MQAELTFNPIILDIKNSNSGYPQFLFWISEIPIFDIQRYQELEFWISKFGISDNRNSNKNI
jgi:hypothetical protein